MEEGSLPQPGFLVEISYRCAAEPHKVWLADDLVGCVGYSRSPPFHAFLGRDETHISSQLQYQAIGHFSIPQLDLHVRDKDGVVNEEVGKVASLRAGGAGMSHFWADVKRSALCRSRENRISQKTMAAELLLLQHRVAACLLHRSIYTSLIGYVWARLERKVSSERKSDKAYLCSFNFNFRNAPIPKDDADEFTPLETSTAFSSRRQSELLVCARQD